MGEDSWIKRKENAAVLASQYTKTKRFGEILSVGSFILFFSLSILNLLPHLRRENMWIITAASGTAMILADLFSGLVHWGADTWGGLETPVVGKTFIRSFREHHVDPFQITRHDWIETNGDNCMLTVPALMILSFLTIGEGNDKDLFIVSFIIMLALFVALTNQIHKWAHMLKPSTSIAWLQNISIILSRRNHQIHHHTPFDRYYCITTGWLNPVLGSIGFWKRIENTITWVTGISPRKDDAFWTVQQPTDSSVPNVQ
jgi:ubiquitin-conjugating enzyme E2 variant